MKPVASSSTYENVGTFAAADVGTPTPVSFVAQMVIARSASDDDRTV